LAAPAGIVVGDENGLVVAVNPAFCAILARREDELIGRDLREHTHPDDIPTQDRAIRELTSGKRSEYASETRYIRADGTTTWAKVRIAAMADLDTGARRFVVHVTDINERKRQERVLAEAEERFRSAFD